MATEIGKAYIQIIPSSQGLKGKLTEILDGEVSSAGDSTGKKLSGAIGAAMKTGLAGATAAVGAASAAVAGLAKKALSSYANYEQLVGGVDKLYGEASGKLQKFADEAFKTSGMSANQYMETATNFSAALVNSLNGDVNKAAELTDVAMRAMSDNVNVFGSDMSSVQYAFQGFAKQNYTMLDNLKLGYGGTKQEMQRLIDDANTYAKSIGQAGDLTMDSFADIIQAVQLIQEKQKIAGTTAKEAMTTIEGSANATKAAWENVITAIGRGDGIREALQGLTSSIFGENSGEGLLNQIVPRIQTIMQGIGDFIAAAGPFITEKLPELIQAIIPPLLESAATLITSLAEGLIQALPYLIDPAMKIIMMLADTIITLLPEIIDVAIQIVTELANGLTQAVPELIPAVVELLLSILDTVTQNLDIMTQAATSLMLGLTDGLINAIPILIDRAPEIIIKLGEALLTSAPQLLTIGFKVCGEFWKGVYKSITNADIVSPLKSKISGVGNWIKGAWGEITAKMSGDWKRSGDDMLITSNDMFGSGGKLQAAFNEFIRTVEGVNKAISLKDMYAEWGGGVIGVFATVFSAIENFCEGVALSIGKLFGVDLYEPVDGFFDKVDKVVFQGFLAKLDELKNNVKDGVTRIWNDIMASFIEGGEGLSGIMEVIFDQLAGAIRGAINIIGEMIGVDMTVLREDIIGNWFEIRDEVVGAVYTLQEGIIGIWNTIVESLRPLLEALQNLFSTIFQAIVVLIQRALTAMSEAVMAAWNNIIAFVTPILQTLQNVFEQAWTAITTVISGKLNEVYQNITSIWNTIAQWLNSKITEIKQFVTNGFTQLAEMLKEPLSKIHNSFTECFNKIRGIVKELISEAVQWGKDMMDALAEGIKAKIDYVVSLINQLAEKIRQYMAFSEPEKGPLSDFHTYAPDMMQLFAQGIKDNTGLITDQIRKSFDFENLIKGQNYEFAMHGPGQVQTGSGSVSGGFVQNLTINSPTELDPSETARLMRNANREMVLQLRMA